MTVGVTMKRFFFDRDVVRNAVDAATLRVLSRAGAMIRLRAQRSQKPKKPGVYSSPGQPPYSHVQWQRNRDKRERKRQGLPPQPASSGFKGLRQIEYFYDIQTRSVIVGPVSRNGGKVPALMEFGGTQIVRRFGIARPARYAKRPFMGPALLAVAPKLGPLWGNSVRVSGSSAVREVQAA